MKKFLEFCFVSLLCLSLISCNSFEAKKDKTYALKQDETVPSSQNKVISNKSDIRLNPYINHRITYTKETIALWINQFIFIKGGDVSGKVVSEFDGDKSKEVLKYYKNNKINKLDLTSFLLKYNLYQGVQRINISPNNKYLALEFGSNECNKTLLVDTDENKAKMLWYNEKNDNSMQNVIWHGNNDYKFYFFPSACLGELYTYNIKDNSKKEIYKISSKDFVPENSIITFNNDNIIVIDTENLKTYKIKY